jgi:phosphoglycolate phosphatase-like HAD superfamily hydrolase
VHTSSSSSRSPEERLKQRRVLFWDFDGVIKESVDVKTRAYVGLFERFGTDVTERVRIHHEANGGLSRFEKIPLYIGWSGQQVTTAEIERYCRLFATTVRQAVIDAPWVPGAREYLLTNVARQRFVLLTATPQAEIEDILNATALAACFSEVYGAPTAKTHAIASVLARWRCDPGSALVIGDSQSDYAAAQSAGVEFLLRQTPLNLPLQRVYAGLQCENFLNE